MSDISKLIGEKIRTTRKFRGLSQEGLAEKAGLNVSFIGQIERGSKKPTIETLDKIVSALDITFAELFSIENRTQTKDSTVIERILFELRDLSVEEQEDLYILLKQILRFRNKT